MSKRPQNNGMVFDVIFERLDEIEERLNKIESVKIIDLVSKNKEQGDR
jgi:hypothetical protein